MPFDLQYAMKIARSVIANVDYRLNENQSHPTDALIRDCAESWLLLLDQRNPDLNSVDLLLARMESAKDVMGTPEYEMYLFANNWRRWLTEAKD